MPLTIYLSIRNALIRDSSECRRRREIARPKHAAYLDTRIQKNLAALAWLDAQKENDVLPIEAAQPCSRTVTH